MKIIKALIVAFVLIAGLVIGILTLSQPSSSLTPSIKDNVSMLKTRQTDVTPPRAEKHPQNITQHGITRVDPYAWLRDDNWQEVLRDPSLLKSDIHAYLTQEGDYYKASTAHLEDLRKTLFQEMRGRIKEDESSVPMREGPFEYYVRYEEGGQYPIYARHKEEGAPEQVLYHGDEEGKGEDFFDIGDVEPSPDHQLIAYGVDRVGSEYYDLRVRRIETGEECGETIPNTDGGVVWAADSKSFFYVERDDHQRPKWVKHHVLGTAAEEDRLVYEEEDDAMFLGLDETSSEAYVVISIGNSVTSEAYVIPKDDPLAAPQLIAPRQHDQLYDIDHRGSYFYIHTNAGGAVDFKVMRAAVAQPGRDHWEEWIPHQAGRYISGFIPFKDYHVRMERENALPRLMISDYDGNEHAIAFEEEAYALGLHGWGEFETEQVRFSYESPSQPEQVFGGSSGISR